MCNAIRMRTESGSKPLCLDFWDVTFYNQVEPSGTKTGSKPLCLDFWDVAFLQPSGTEWNRIRNRATLLGFLGRRFLTTKWNRVEPSQEPSCLLGFLAKTISAPSLIIILIKSRDSRNRGPQNEINCRILYTNKNQKLISHRSESDVCEMVLLIFLGECWWDPSSKQGVHAKGLVLKMARTFGTPQGHFLSLPQPLSKAHVLNV